MFILETPKLILQFNILLISPDNFLYFFSNSVKLLLSYPAPADVVFADKDICVGYCYPGNDTLILLYFFLKFSNAVSVSYLLFISFVKNEGSILHISCCY
jgi:hypothetical protein